MKALLACLLAISLVTATQAQTPAFQAPSGSQVWDGQTTWWCSKDSPANIDVQGQNADGNYYGIGYIVGYACGSRGGRGYTLYNACADVVWDPTGLILSVTPFAQTTGRPSVVPCTL